MKSENIQGEVQLEVNPDLSEVSCRTSKHCYSKCGAFIDIVSTAPSFLDMRIAGLTSDLLNQQHKKVPG